MPKCDNWYASMTRWVRSRMVVAILALLGTSACAPSSDTPVPNVLLISMDTTRRDHCSVYGYERATTPNLVGFATEGVRFDLAYAPTSTTGPTHASVFTSLYPLTHRVVKNGLSLALKHTTLAEALQANGYQTAAFVSSFVLDAKFGYAQGFETYEDDFTLEETTLRKSQLEGQRIVGGFDRRADRTTSLAIEWLGAARDPSRPFFLFVHYFDPHDPYVPPPPFQDRFVSLPRTTGSVEEAISLYDGEIAFVDQEIGRLLDAVDRLGLEKQTLAVLFADHGEGLMDHGHMAHGVHIYEEAVRVPMIARWPGQIPENGVLKQPVEILDILPTIGGLLGVPPYDPRWRGRDLSNALRAGHDEADSKDRPVFLHRRHYEEGIVREIPVRGEKFGLRLGDLKYIEGPEEGTRELFDLIEDPGERNNLAAVHVATADTLAERLHRWIRSEIRAGKPGRISEEDRERLRSLGYIN